MEALRLAGIALLSASVFAGGIAVSHAQREPLRYTAAFMALITRLRGFIEYNRGELANLYVLCAGGDTALLESAGFLENASKHGWDKSVELLCDHIFIDSDTYSALVEFGSLLGKTCVDEQLRNCDRTTARLDYIIKARTPEVKNKAKLYRTLSISAALTLLIILM